jgi:hypothetical protein
MRKKEEHSMAKWIEDVGMKGVHEFADVTMLKLLESGKMDCTPEDLAVLAYNIAEAMEREGIKREDEKRKKIEESRMVIKCPPRGM